MDIRPKHYGIARVISKRGYCSRSEAEKAVRDGRVTLNGHFVMNPETRILMDADITLDGELINEEKKIYLALYKPRGIITTASDEKGRKTVMDLVAPLGLPHIAPVGRLDAASEGLLLLTNDTAFADRVLSPEHHWEKEYHVQVEGIPTKEDLQVMEDGMLVPPRVFGDKSEQMRVESATFLKESEKTSWLKIVLMEGKNREIRRMLAELGFEVLRLIRVRVGKVELGNLKSGETQQLTLDDIHGKPKPKW